FPHIFPAFNDIKNPERYAVAYPEGETIGEVQQRFIKFISRLNEEKHTNVLLITHGMLIRIFAETCLKKNILLENASLLKVSYDEKNKKFRTPKILF
ncbi:MAG: histidine phosphatase family protein, partial [Alphaproteobacteria bacterium]|nr:histidine phosphatase family protein [Alphaproteobacteria bacterium]